MARSIPSRLCIVGAGAIGCTLAARLAATGQPVNMFARGNTLTALNENGVRLTDLDGEHNAPVNASDDCVLLGEQDVVFLCVKAQSLPTLVPHLAPLIGPHTTVVPVVNGVPWWYFHGESGNMAGQPIQAVDPDGTLLASLDPAHILGCVVFITAETISPGQARSHNPHLMILGEPNNRKSQRLETIRQLIEDAGIEARASDRIRDSLWTKILANLTSNPLSVITGATLEELYSQPELTPLVGKILHEGLLTAAAYGARIDFDPPTFMKLGAGMGAVKTSMLQDYQHGRALELAAIGDAVVELAEHHGLGVPTTRDILSLARFLTRPPSRSSTDIVSVIDPISTPSQERRKP